MSNITSTSKGGYPGGTKIYRALLTQSGTDAPVATVLTNTIGGIIWTRVSQGQYRGTLANSFPSNKPVVFCTSGAIDNFADSGFLVTARRVSENQIEVVSADVGVTGADGEISQSAIEIIIYP